MSVPETPQTPVPEGTPPRAAENPPAPTRRSPLLVWLADLWAAARLHPPVFTGLAARYDAFLHGFLIVLVISLLTGIPIFVGEIVGAVALPSAGEPAEQSTALRESLEATGPLLDRLGVPADTRADIVAEVSRAFGLALQIRQEVDQLPTTFPRPVGAVLEALGTWVSLPFSGALPFGSGVLPLAVVSLGAWLGYGFWVMLAAKLLGGRGTLHGFFGATALYAVPHVLDLFGWVPFIGGILGFIAYVWGAVVYVKATQASHQLSFERALIAVLLPIVLFVLIIIGVLSVLAGLAWLRG